MTLDWRRMIDLWKIPAAKMWDNSPATIRRLKEQALLEYAAVQQPGSYEALAAAAELKRRESYTARLAIGLSFLSLIVSTAVASHFYNKQFRLASEMPLKAALYSARVQSLRDFSRSSSELDAALHEAFSKLVITPGDARALSGFDDHQMDAILPTARRAMAAYQKYNSDITGAQAVWPASMVDKINRSQLAALNAIQCFSIIGVHIDGSHRDWDLVREEAAVQCAHARDTSLVFATTSAETMQAMRETVATVR